MRTGGAFYCTGSKKVPLTFFSLYNIKCIIRSFERQEFSTVEKERNVLVIKAAASGFKFKKKLPFNLFHYLSRFLLLFSFLVYYCYTQLYYSKIINIQIIVGLVFLYTSLSAMGLFFN